MQAQLALLLLCSTCVLCTDVSQDQRGIEEEIFGGLLAAQTKQKQSAPSWPTSLVTLCRFLSNRPRDVSSTDEEVAEVEEEEEEEEVRGLMEESLHLLEEASNLQHICGALQGRGDRQILQESLEYLEENIDSPLKRKSPYILKRQTGRASKSRRPYILKRSAIY